MKKIELEDDKQSIEIKLSKTKNLLMIIGSLSFVLIGVSFIIDSQGWISSSSRRSAAPAADIAVLYVAGIASVSFFGTILLYGLYKLTDTNVGLRLDSDGFYDNSNASSLGLIHWQDITGIETVEVASTKMLVVFISNNEEYINNASNFFVKFLAKVNKKQYGSPIVFSTVSLKTDFDSLRRLVKRSWGKFR